MWKIGFLFVFSLVFYSGVSQECDEAWRKPRNDVFKKRNYYKNQEKDYATDGNTLKLIHVVFRHGDRTSDPDTLYPLDPYYNYTYYPYGLGQLTNLGKKQEYQIGKALRKRYNSFLGDIYTPEVLEARSTDVNRTKMSLELVLAGLWPPVKDQLWNNELLWLPIPYNYWKDDEDVILGDPNIACPRYKQLYNKNLLSEQNVIENEKLKNFYNYLSYHMGLNFSQPIDVYNYYFTLKAEFEWGLELPTWTKCVWPDKFLEVALKQYELFTQTSELTGLSAGQLIDKIIEDSKVHMSKDSSTEQKKIFLYSGHERNIAFTLIALGIYKPHIPPYASYVLMELHEVDGIFGFKVFYQDYSEEEPKLMSIPGCEQFCPFDKFYKLVYSNLPHVSCTL